MRRRAGRALAALAPHGLVRAAALARIGEVDQALEAVLLWAPWDHKGDGWGIMTSLASDLLTWEKKRHGWLRLPTGKKPLPAGDFRAYRAAASPRFVNEPSPVLTRGPCAVRAESIIAPGRRLDSSLLLSGGDVRCRTLFCSVVFANGDVEVDEAYDSVIVCMGEARVKEPSHCLVISRGSVQARLMSVAVVVSASKTVLPRSGRGNGVFVENEANPLGFVRFFETARVGIEVAKAKNRDGARIVKLGHASAFARAGLWRDDVVTAVDGAAVKTPEQFRRAVLRRLVEGGEAELRVWREGERMTVYVTPRL